MNSIILKPYSIPTLHFKKRIPLALNGRVKAELNRLKEQKVISSVDYPTNWVDRVFV